MGIIPVLGILSLIWLNQPDELTTGTTKISTFLNMSFFVHLDSQ